MTKITNIEIREVKADLKSAFTGGTYQVKHRAGLLCRISTDDGVMGEACIGNESSYSDYLKSLIRGPFKKLLVGQSPLLIERHWQSMLTFDKAYIDRAALMMAIATVDATLWDLKGKLAELPLWQILGGYRPTVPLIAIGGYYETSTDEKGIRQEIQECRRAGLAGIKFKVGALSIDKDVERLRIARDEAGPEFAIVADSNLAWSVDEAITFARRTEEFEPVWYEEPIRSRDYVRGMQQFRLKAGVRTGAGQSDVSVFNSAELIEAKAVDVINATYNRGGGITGWMKLASAASFANIQMGQVGEPHIGMHLHAAIPNGSFAECYMDPARDPLWHELYVDFPKAIDGEISLPEVPGIGLNLNPAAVEKYAVEAWS